MSHSPLVWWHGVEGDIKNLLAKAGFIVKEDLERWADEVDDPGFCRIKFRWDGRTTG